MIFELDWEREQYSQNSKGYGNIPPDEVVMKRIQKRLGRSDYLFRYIFGEIHAMTDHGPLKNATASDSLNTYFSMLRSRG